MTVPAHTVLQKKSQQRFRPRPHRRPHPLRTHASDVNISHLEFEHPELDECIFLRAYALPRRPVVIRADLPIKYAEHVGSFAEFDLVVSLYRTICDRNSR